MTERANKLAVYYLNINKRYDLDVRTTFILLQNYLQYKPIGFMDWIRCGYYLFMFNTGLADTYRNE